MNLIEKAALQYQRSLKNSASRSEAAFREKAWAKFSESELSVSDEKKRHILWKKAGLGTLLKLACVPAPAPLNSKLEGMVERYKRHFELVVLVDGVLQKDLSTSAVEVTEFRDPLPLEEGFSGLVAAASQPGYRLNVPAGCKLERPILIVHEQGANSEWVSCYHEIRVGRAAKVDIAEIFYGASSNLRTEITHVRLEEGASLNMVRVEADSATSSHYSDLNAYLESSANLHLTQIALGAGWTRGNLNAELMGNEAEVHIDGLCFGRGEQEIDQRVRIRHHAPRTSSSQLFKGIYKDSSRGSITGRIWIAPQAQKVTSSQLNQSLLLSKDAEAVTQPELEVYADDVKANHGATVGRLDQEKIFYLVSRGIEPTEAQRILARAFVEDVLMKIRSRSLKEWTESVVEELQA